MQSGQLDVIKADNPTNTNECCINLFTKWLEVSKDATWEKMFEAIDTMTNSLSCDNTGITNNTTTSTGK